MAGQEQNFALIRTEIRIDGTDDAVNFTDLLVVQALADVCAFSFRWRQDRAGSAISNHVAFLQQHLAKEVTINIQNNFSFKGIIRHINARSDDSGNLFYEITGKGIFQKLNEVSQCRSFYKKDLKTIFNGLNNAQGTTMRLQPTNTDELFYTVQYNQTVFDCYRMLAARWGEWLYFDGTDLVLGAPSGNALEMVIGKEVHQVNLGATIRQPVTQTAGFDYYKGDPLQYSGNATNGGDELSKAGIDGGLTAYGSSQKWTNYPHAVTNDLLTSFADLESKAAGASVVRLSAVSYNSRLNLGGTISLKDAQGNAIGDFLITDLSHSCISDNHYENYFIAVPASVEVPPYTNSFSLLSCQPQLGIIAENEDSDGMDRVKVHMPWQEENETTPWISVATPHAGKDKGIRFLPEKGEEVLVDFIDGNPERPFVLGAIHTEKNKSGNEHKGNNLKIIGTKSGRRLEIDDDKGLMKLYDNYTDKTPKNGILFKRDKDNTELLIESQKSADDYSVISLSNSEHLNLGVVKGGALIAEIRLESDGKKITIHSKGSIELNADQSISLNSGTINIKASQELNMEGGTGVALKGMKIALEADTTMDIKGLGTTVEGSATADFKGGGIASISGALVKIN